MYREVLHLNCEFLKLSGFMYYISTLSAAGRVGPQNRAPRYAEISPIGLKMGCDLFGPPQAPTNLNKPHAQKWYRIK